MVFLMMYFNSLCHPLREGQIAQLATMATNLLRPMLQIRSGICIGCKLTLPKIRFMIAG